MTNDSNLRCYVVILGVSMTSIIVFDFFCCYTAFWPYFLYFETCILELKLGIDHGLKLGNDISVLNDVLAHFMAIFSFLWCFSAAFLCYFGTFVGCSIQYLSFLSNLQVNFNELTIIYPTVLFPPNIYIANLALGLDDILDTWQ